MSGDGRGDLREALRQATGSRRWEGEDVGRESAGIRPVLAIVRRGLRGVEPGADEHQPWHGSGRASARLPRQGRAAA